MANQLANVVRSRLPITLEMMEGKGFKVSKRFTCKKRGCLPWEFYQKEPEVDERSECVKKLCQEIKTKYANLQEVCDPCFRPDECAEFFKKIGPINPNKTYPMNEVKVKQPLPGGPVSNWEAIQAKPPKPKPEGC